MRIAPHLLAGVAALFCPAARADGVPFRAPIAASHLHPGLYPGYHHPDFTGLHSPATQAAIRHGLAAGTLTTLPNWSAGFTVNGVNYSYTLIGTDPSQGPATTIIPTIIVPIRLTIPDYVVNGQPLVLDGSSAVTSVLHSPIFRQSDYDSGRNLQFTDAMLHAEFPAAPSHWHLRLAPTVASVLDVTTTPGETDVYVAKSGKYAATINDHVIDRAIVKSIRANFDPSAYVIFVTYDAVENDAFGYHSGLMNNAKTGLEIFTYAAWLEDVADVFGLPSPNSATLAHEAAEIVHDAFGTSKTLEWGDWFNHNSCFQDYIEVGDAVEHAPPKVQNTPQAVTINGKPHKYTVQSEALLPYFTRQYPSNAIHQAYSWPNEKAILGPAPLYCDKI